MVVETTVVNSILQVFFLLVCVASGEFCIPKYFTYYDSLAPSHACPRLNDPVTHTWCCGNDTSLLFCCPNQNKSAYTYLHDDGNEHIGVGTVLIIIYGIAITLMFLIDCTSRCCTVLPKYFKKRKEKFTCV